MLTLDCAYILKNFVECTDGDIGLRNSTLTLDSGKTLRTYLGRVDVCVNGSFLPICDVGWDNHDAQVVCRQQYGDNFG